MSRRRVDIKATLDNPVKRKKMIDGICGFMRQLDGDCAPMIAPEPKHTLLSLLESLHRHAGFKEENND